ncbi:hypothetical protein [Terricaulis sp.]|uniref:hypothetical protein n=1 Tax=Terricaulis sp. TaxID=2768686 RepID=UPI0037848B37
MAHDADRAKPDAAHRSPDGALTLNVFNAGWVAFEGFEWHAHGDAAALAAEILADHVTLDLRWKHGAIEDVRALFGVDDIADYLTRAEKYQLPDERIELRTWSGAPAPSHPFP